MEKLITNRDPYIQRERERDREREGENQGEHKKLIDSDRKLCIFRAIIV